MIALYLNHAIKYLPLFFVLPSYSIAQIGTFCLEWHQLITYLCKHLPNQIYGGRYPQFNFLSVIMLKYWATEKNPNNLTLAKELCNSACGVSPN